MKSIIILSSTLLLAGCGGDFMMKYAKAQAFIDGVRAKATAICGFQPTAAMVSNVTASMYLNDKDASDVAAINDVAAKLCAAISLKPVE